MIEHRKSEQQEMADGGLKRHVVLRSSGTLMYTLPPLAEGQTGWYIDSPGNRYIQGETFIARDWFPPYIHVADPPGRWHRALWWLRRLLK